jgi:hypothetical protein
MLVVEALRASTIAADKNPLAVRPAASQQSDSAVIGPTEQARLGLADDPRRIYVYKFCYICSAKRKMTSDKYGITARVYRNEAILNKPWIKTAYIDCFISFELEKSACTIEEISGMKKIVMILSEKYFGFFVRMYKYTYDRYGESEEPELTGYSYISLLMTLNLLSLQVIIHPLFMDTVYFYENLRSIGISAVIFVSFLNYFLLMRKKKYLKIVTEFKEASFKFSLYYALISIFVFFVSLVLANLQN